jgi:serpin B
MTRFVLVNAIYLKAPWLVPFGDGSTVDAPFTRSDGTRTEVPTMATTWAMPYAEGDGWRAVDLPYVGGELSMLLILPDDIEGWVAAADATTLRTVASALAPVRVDLRLPTFGIETSAELGDHLIALGMPSAFDEMRADFSGITTAERLMIAEVVHQANIDVDESGTEAAAATAVIGVTTGGPPPETIELRFDRPFVFAVRDVPTGAVLFLGTVGDPSAR